MIQLNEKADTTAIKQQKKIPGRPFKKGQSGNPKGRPKDSISLTSLLKRELQNIAKDDPNKRQYAELLVKKLLVSKALNEGDMQAIKEIFERVDGKVSQSFEFENPIELNVNIKTAIDKIYGAEYKSG